jgi:hypothetical protein
VIACIEGATCTHRNPERSEEIAVDCPLLDVEAVSSGHLGASFRAAENGSIPTVVGPAGGKKGNRARCVYAGNGLQTPRQLVVERAASRRVVAGAGKVHFERDHIVNVKPKIDLLQAIETRQQHSGAGEERQRERELDCGQAASKASLSP